MRMEHKPMENLDEELQLKFRPSPVPTYHPPQSPQPQMTHSYSRHSDLSTTKRIFEEKIRTAESEEALRVSQVNSQVSRPWKERPKSDMFSDVYLEPGPEPEFGFAPKPKFERKKSLVETLVEENIEQQLQTEPARVPPGGVRLLPMMRNPPLTPKQPEKRYSAPVLPERIPEPMNLEPFPFSVPETSETPQKPIFGAPPTPSKFVKGVFSDTNYESDFSDYSYFEKKFKSVAPPRPNSTTPSHTPVNTGRCETPKYDFTSLPLKQMIQNGTSIPLPTPYQTQGPKPRPLSAGYAADTEEHFNHTSSNHTDSFRQNQVRVDR